MQSLGNSNVSTRMVTPKKLMIIYVFFSYQYNINNFVALTEAVEVWCPRHPGATTFGSQLQDGDHTDGWQNLTRHTETQWKAKGGEGREQIPLNAPHIILLLPVTLINKSYNPEHEEFHSCASILTPLTN